MPTAITTSDMSADQRLEAVAAILAQGVLRYHQYIKRLESDPGKNCLDSSSRGLEVLGKTRLSVSQRAGG